MPATTQIPEPLAKPSFLRTIPRGLASAQHRREFPIILTSLTEPNGLFLPLFTASIAAHLILVSWFGGGVPQPAVRRVREALPPTPAAIIEEVQLQAEPSPQTPPPVNESEPTPDAPSPAAELDLPPLPQLQAIAAVPSSVAVAFGIEVKGLVRLVADAANASGAVGARRSAEPVALDLQAQHDLLLPAITYPAKAKRQRLAGSVLIEFRTNATGEISDVRVREGSGHEILDRAALENLRAGRWKGRPGFYVKAYEFTLQ